MENYEQNNKEILDLISKFFFADLSDEEMKILYNYINDKDNQDIIPFLEEIWEKMHENNHFIIPNSLFEYIQEKIDLKNNCQEKKSDKKIRYNINIKSIKKYLGYVAVFIIAFGISWIIHQLISDNNLKATDEKETFTFNEIIVPYGSKTMTILSDGTKVWLNAGARFNYPSGFGATRDVYLQGEAYFDVTKKINQPFFVHCNGIKVKVRGTKFNLMANSDDDFIEATLLEGAIEILDLKNENSQKNNLVLEPGQKLTLYIDKEGSNIQTINTDGMLIPEKGNAIARIKNTNLTDSFNLEQSTAWTNNKLVFTRERFKDVKTKLERWYGVNIEVKNEEILNYHFTGTFENETFEQAMSALSAAAGCSFKTNKNQVIVSK